MTAPYYADDLVTLFLGDCREVTGWLEADVLVTDPPYGRGWGKHGDYAARGHGVSGGHAGIAGDKSTEMRDAVLAAWGDRPAVAFGDLMFAPPSATKQVLVYGKPPAAGFFGAVGGFYRDAEAVYLIGPWVLHDASMTSILRTGTRNITILSNRYGHPHAKPVDVLETLIGACPSGIIADPFAGAGSTLVAARNLGRQAIGVEIDEAYCEKAARRLSQGVLVEAVTA